METQQANAMKIARFLEGHSLIEKVYYPGLESHPRHALAKTQQRGFGAMLSFDTKDGRSIAERVCMKTRLFDVCNFTASQGLPPSSRKCHHRGDLSVSIRLCVAPSEERQAYCGR